MSRKALDWALHLRGELVERMDELRTVLADIEPLRRELERLEAQLEGVERLIGVYVNQLGCPDPRTTIAITTEVLAQQPDAPVPAPAADNLSLGAAARAFAEALRAETVRAAHGTGERLRAAWIAGRLWVTTTLLKRRREQ